MKTPIEIIADKMETLNQVGLLPGQLKFIIECMKEYRNQDQHKKPLKGSEWEPSPRTTEERKKLRLAIEQLESQKA